MKDSKKENSSSNSLAEEFVKSLPAGAEITVDSHQMERFNQICSWAKSEGKDESIPYRQPHITVLFRKQIKVSICPITYLAYQGEHKAVNFLLEQCTDNSAVVPEYAFAGYILRGNFEFSEFIMTNYIKKEQSGTEARCVTSILNYFAVVGHFLRIFSYYNEIVGLGITTKCWRNHVDEFREVLCFTGIVKDPYSLLAWTIGNQKFIDHPLLSMGLNDLKKRAIINYDPFPVIKTAKASMKTWTDLHVWLWQGPRLMQKIALPAVIITHVASFLYSKPADEKLYNYALLNLLPYIGTKQLLLFNLNFIGENRLCSLFEPIEERESLSKAVQAELETELQKETQSEAVIKALQSCQFRLLPLLGSKTCCKSFLASRTDLNSKIKAG
jgi:hypothetical protein